MLVKCQICNSKIERDSAYKITVKDKNLYYCSDQEYLNYKQNLKDKDDVYIEIDNIFNRKVVHTILFKEVNELAQIYTYKIVLSYLRANNNYLKDVLKRDFVSEYAQIRYFTAILKNSLKDYKDTTIIINEIKKEVTIDRQNIYSNNYKPQQKRKSLAELELELGGE